MMDLIQDFARDVAENLPVSPPVLEVGARPADDQTHFPGVRSFFPEGIDYIGIDIQEGRNVDQVEDVHALSFGDETFGTVICLETLEHVADPIRAVEQMRRVLKPGGILALSSPAPFFPIHAHPWDFWRFTPEGFAQLLKDFETSWVTAFGFELMPQHVFGIGIKGPYDGLALESLPRLNDWVTHWGAGHPVDFGPMRMKTGALVRRAAGETVNAARRTLRSYRDRALRRPAGR